jgi:hypothetical protein
MKESDHFDFLPLTLDGFDEVLRRRRRDACVLCRRRKSHKLLSWPVYPEYARIAGTPPGLLGVITVGLCQRCLGERDAVKRGFGFILRLLADRARARGLRMPPTPEIPVIEVPI